MQQIEVRNGLRKDSCLLLNDGFLLLSYSFKMLKGVSYVIKVETLYTLVLGVRVYKVSAFCK